MVAIPSLFMELALGQYVGLSAIKIYSRLAPALRGLGHGMTLIPTVINFYYTVVMAYAVFFLYSGFTTGPLPWTDCSHSFNTMQCFSTQDQSNCQSVRMTQTISAFFRSPGSRLVTQPLSLRFRIRRLSGTTPALRLKISANNSTTIL